MHVIHVVPLWRCLQVTKGIILMGLLPHVFLAGASCQVKKDTDQFQLSLRATEATSNVQDFHVEANFLLRQTKACKCATKTKNARVNPNISSI